MAYVPELEYERKDVFVRTKLKPLLMDADDKIVSVWYSQDPHSYPHECVSVEYALRDGGTRVVDVNVNMDSKMMLVKDVLEAISI